MDETLIRALGALGSLAYLPMLRRPFFKVESHHFLLKGMQGDDFFRMAVHGDFTAELDRVRAFVEAE